MSSWRNNYLPNAYRKCQQSLSIPPACPFGFIARDHRFSSLFYFARSRGGNIFFGSGVYPTSARRESIIILCTSGETGEPIFASNPAWWKRYLRVRESSWDWQQDQTTDEARSTVVRQDAHIAYHDRILFTLGTSYFSYSRKYFMRSD